MAFSSNEFFNSEVSHLMNPEPSTSSEGNNEEDPSLRELLSLDQLSYSKYKLHCGNINNFDSESTLNLFPESNLDSTTGVVVELDSSNINENHQLTRSVNLVELKSKKKGFFQSSENIILIKPLDKSKSNPGRIVFRPSGNTVLQISDTLKIFIRDVNKSSIQWNGIPNTSDTLCSCFSKHQFATFCVITQEEANVLTWSNINDATASVFVNNVDKLDVQFAPLVCQSEFQTMQNILELVFQVEKTYEIFEQTYFIRFCASPSRDITTFVKKLEMKGLVSLPRPIKKEEPGGQRVTLLKLDYNEEDLEELKEVLRLWKGRKML